MLQFLSWNGLMATGELHVGCAICELARRCVIHVHAMLAAHFQRYVWSALGYFLRVLRGLPYGLGYDCCMGFPSIQLPAHATGSCPRQNRSRCSADVKMLTGVIL